MNPIQSNWRDATLIAVLGIVWIIACGPLISERVPVLGYLAALAYLWIPLAWIWLVAGPVLLAVYLVRRKHKSRDPIDPVPPSAPAVAIGDSLRYDKRHELATARTPGSAIA